MHRYQSYQTPFKCIGPILTTCRVFSLFKMPSRRPRVMPATLSSLVPLIMWLSAEQLEHGHTSEQTVRTFATRNTNAFSFNLEAQTAFIFPQSSGHTRLHAWWGNLASVIKGVRLVVL